MRELVTCLGGGEPSFTALHAHPENLDGIIYMSRHLNVSCLVSISRSEGSSPGK